MANLMYYFKSKGANLISKQDAPVSWITPLGLPVV
jgi:hypothetical protein